MNRLVILIILLIVQTQFYSCHISNDKENICHDNFKKARDLAYRNPTNPAALDSALIIIDRCIECDSIKTAVVDFKIRLLIALGKLKEGADFVNSLKASDFVYPYKKKLNHDNFIALNFTLNKDTINRNKVFQEMIADLEKYITVNTLKTKEFQEIYTEYFTIKENFVDSVSINTEIDSLKIKYPENAKFFDFFKQ